MSAAIVSAQDCCQPCTSPVVENIPGPAGSNGAPGAAGSAGANAFTIVSAQFTQPASGSNVNVSVGHTDFLAVGQDVFVETGGYYLVNAINSAISVSLKNRGYIGNAAPGVNIPNASKLSVGGHIGTAGASGSTPTLNDISPTTSKGDLIVDTGANNPLPADVRLGAGSNGQILTALSTQPTGLEWQTLLPNAATDNLLPRYDASGTTIPTPLQTSAMRLTDNGALQETGGNAKGTDAVDLQPSRTLATQVASGNNATIAGGRNNTSSGNDSSVVGGQGNIASASRSHVGGGSTNTASGAESVVAGGVGNTANATDSTIGGGISNTSSGINSTCAGGNTNVASGPTSTIAGGASNVTSGNESSCGGGALNTASEFASTVPGGLQAVADKYGQVAHASGAFVAAGDAQSSELIWRISTVDATANVEMFLDGASATKRAMVPANTTWAFNIIGVARRSNGDSITFEVKGAVKNDAGTTVLVAAVTAIVVADGTAGALTIANFTVDADNANDSLRIRVTGIAAQTWRWVAHARLVECNH